MNIMKNCIKKHRLVHKKFTFTIYVLFILVFFNVNSLANITDDFQYLPQIQNVISPTLKPDNGILEYWAICVGPTDRDTRFNLNAEMVKYVLCDHGWKEDHIRLLTGQLATRKNFYDALSWLNESVKEEDVVLVWLIDHGGPGYFFLDDSVLFYDEFDEELDKLISNKIGIVISACYSGSAIPILRQSGRIIIASSLANETSGTLERECLYALQGHGDYLGNNNGMVSIEEMFDYLAFHVDSFLFTPIIDDKISGEVDISFIDPSDQHPDQFQKWFYNFPVTINEQMTRAQSFKPSTNKINRLKLLLGRGGDPGPINISIRNNLTGFDLTSVEVTKEDIRPPGNAYLVYDLYLPEITVIPNLTYYIVCQTKEEPGYNHGYSVMLSLSPDYDAYDQGTHYYKIFEGEWVESSYGDFCFSTFYSEQQPPNTPIKPSGPTDGKPGDSLLFSTVSDDFESDDLYYWFDWGDETYSGWIGPISVNESIIIAHSWQANGDYLIKVKAKDDQGYESGWSDSLSVSIMACGDANGDSAVNVGDAVFLINYVFKGGPAPDPLCSGDANGDEEVNIADAVYLINYIFSDGPSPVDFCCL